MARRVEMPQDYRGPRTVIRSKGTICGWCLTQNHEDCKHELAYYDKLWVCSCTCNDSWVPQDVGTIEPETKKKRGKDVLRDLQVSTDSGETGSADSSHGEERAELPGGDGSVEEQPVLGDDESIGE